MEREEYRRAGDSEIPRGMESKEKRIEPTREAAQGRSNQTRMKRFESDLELNMKKSKDGLHRALPPHWWLQLIPQHRPRAPGLHPAPRGCLLFPSSRTLLQLPECQAAQGRRWQRRAGWGRPAGAQSSSWPELQRTDLQTAPRPQVVEHWLQFPTSQLAFLAGSRSMWGPSSARLGSRGWASGALMLLARLS